MATDLNRKEELPELTARIVESYKQIPTMNHLGHCPLPSTEAIIEMAQKLKEILYPGYRRRQNLHLGNVMYHVGDLVDSLHDSMTQQFSRAFRSEYQERHGVSCGNEHVIDFEAMGQEAAIQFLNRIPDLREMLAADVQAAYDGDPAAKSLDEIIFCYPGLEAVTIHRIAHELHRLNVPLVPRILSEWSHLQTGIDIHPGAQIGPSFFIDHGTGVVIGETCIIADHVKLYQGVTLGALSFPRDENGNIIRNQKRHPTIQSGVVIYANATILGGDTVVGHHAVIGSNVWLTQSVEPYTIVSLEKPQLRIKSDSRSSAWVYQI